MNTCLAKSLGSPYIHPYLQRPLIINEQKESLSFQKPTL